MPYFFSWVGEHSFPPIGSDPGEVRSYSTRRECLLCPLESQGERLVPMAMGNKPEFIRKHTRQSLVQGRYSHVSNLTTKMGSCWGMASDKEGKGGRNEQKYSSSASIIFLSLIGSDVTKPELASEHWI